MAAAKRKKSHRKTARQAEKNIRRRSLASVVGPGLVIAALIVHLYLVLQYNFTQDDAYITFRYAANFLDGHGLVYNVGERVEGYTNFLWTILMIFGAKTGIGFILFSKILGAACGLATILLLYLTAGRVFGDLPNNRKNLLAGACCLLLGAVYSFAYWAVAGLETAAFTLMVLASVYFYLRRSYLSAASLVAATLLRPEGGLVFAILVVYDILTNRRLSRYVLVVGILYLLYLLPLAAFKWFYYGSVLPNPFYAKTSFTFEQVTNGLEYTGQFFWHYLAAGLFVVPAIIVVGKASKAMRMIMIFCLVYILYIALIGGDVLKVHRFFVPLFPLLILAAVYGLQFLFKNRYLIALSLAALLVWQMIVPRNHVETFNQLEKSLALKMDILMSGLEVNDNSNFSMAASTIGMIGYKLLGHTVIDLLGLTDSTIARHPEPAIKGLESTWRESQFNSGYVLSRQPDYIIFSTGFKPSAPAERSLFLYSAFLNNYRTIAFSIGGTLNSIFKRYYPIRDDIKRDVDVNFVQYYNEAINRIWDHKDYDGGLALLDSAYAHAPEPKYPYLYYDRAYAVRMKMDMETSYRLLHDLCRRDTLVYETYKDLYTYEYLIGNYEAAEYFLGQTARLVPWYISELEGRVRGKSAVQPGSAGGSNRP